MHAGSKLAGALALAGTLSFAPQQAEAASLFEALFGSDRPLVYVPAPRYAYPSFQVVQPRRSIQRHPPRRSSGRAGTPDRIFTSRDRPDRTEPRLSNAPLSPAEQASPLAPFLRDKTLHSGDAVVTRAGLFIFSGVAGRARPSDFKPLDVVHRTRALPRQTGRQLLALQRGNRFASRSGLIVAVKADPVPGQQAQPGPQIVASDRRAETQ